LDKTISLTPESLTPKLDQYGNALRDQYGNVIYETCYMNIEDNQTFQISAGGSTEKVFCKGNTPDTSNFRTLCLLGEGIDFTWVNGTQDICDPCQTGCKTLKMSTKTAALAKSLYTGCIGDASTEWTKVSNPTGSINLLYDCADFKVETETIATGNPNADTIKISLQEQPVYSIGQTCDETKTDETRAVTPDSKGCFLTDKTIQAVLDGAKWKIGVDPDNFCGKNGDWSFGDPQLDGFGFCDFMEWLYNINTLNNKVFAGLAENQTLELSKTPSAPFSYTERLPGYTIAASIPLTDVSAAGLPKFYGFTADTIPNGFSLFAKVTMHCNFSQNGESVSGTNPDDAVLLTSLTPKVNGTFVTALGGGTDAQTTDNRGRLATSSNEFFANGDLTSTGIFKLTPGKPNTISALVAAEGLDNQLDNITFPSFTVGELWYYVELILVKV
jgi:hypothetical protein